jgi:DNA mismatch endonuclease (patch repair protein)
MQPKPIGSRVLAPGGSPWLTDDRAVQQISIFRFAETSETRRLRRQAEGNAPVDFARCSVPSHMTDFLARETRSRVMARIRSKDTKPELALRRGLWAAGVRGWRCHSKRLPGKPDLAFGRANVAVFVDGRFWHGHPDYFTFGKSGPYWDAKIARTQERDRKADAALACAGWVVLRFWDFEVEERLESCVSAVVEAVDEGRRAQGRAGARTRSRPEPAPRTAKQTSATRATS